MVLEASTPWRGRESFAQDQAPARAPLRPSALEIAQGNFLTITVTSRAPALPVNHYMGKAVFLWLSGLFLQLAGFITGQGPWLVFGLHTDRRPIGPSSALTA